MADPDTEALVQYLLNPDARDTPIEACFYGVPEYDPRGYYVARCPKHPEMVLVALRPEGLAAFHAVAKTPES